MSQPSIVILLSGNGSNLQAIIDAQLNIDIKAVISDQANAYGLTRAQQASIDTHILTTSTEQSREDYDQQLIALIDQLQPNFIILAGFMRILSAAFIAHFPQRIINIHPSLLPRHKGLDTHTKALAAGDHEHGCSIHLVTAELDSGPIIAQARCPILPGDDATSLQQRAHTLEHQLYPTVLQWLADKRLNLSDQGITLDGNTLPPQGKQLQQFPAKGQGNASLD